MCVTDQINAITNDGLWPTQYTATVGSCHSCVHATDSTDGRMQRIAQTANITDLFAPTRAGDKSSGGFSPGAMPKVARHWNGGNTAGGASAAGSASRPLRPDRRLDLAPFGLATSQCKVLCAVYHSMVCDPMYGWADARTDSGVMCI